MPTLAPDDAATRMMFDASVGMSLVAGLANMPTRAIGRFGQMTSIALV
ncbi:MAG TPA: hypothetical protein VG056_13660 [Pirellulales bacterium]|nr:hypothetical protein [Pirellulales bacterium]